MALIRGRLFAHLETWRPYTAFYVGLVGIAGAALAADHASPGRLVAAWAVPTLGWIGGLYGGDYFDRHLDAEAKPHRPIPSGRLSAGAALTSFLLCIAIGFGLSILLNWRTVVFVALASVIGIAYSTLFKARGLSGNLVRGSMTALAFLYGAMMVTDLPPLRLLPLALVFWLHDAASNLVGAVRDIDGDRKSNYLTFAVTHGVKRSMTVVAGLLVGAYTLTVAAPSILDRPLSTAFMVTVLLAVITATWAIGPLFRVEGSARKPAYRAHTVLVLTRILLAGSFLEWRLGGFIAPAIVVAALLLTSISQRLLRARHEFSTTKTPPLTEEAVREFVDRQLAVLGELPALSTWDRVIDIRLRDPEVHLTLRAKDGRVVLGDGGAPTVRIETTGKVFQDIFLLNKSNPRRAYLTRQLSINASAADMIRLNQLFNRFRSSTGPATTTPVEPPTTDALPAVVVISDTTLRDGEQMPGVVFSAAEKREIARRLNQARIPLIEAGFPAVSDDEAAAVKAIVDDGGDALIQAIARPLDRDIDAAVNTGAHSIAVFIGTSDSHLKTKLHLTVDEAKTAVDKAVRRAKSHGRQVVFAAEDATRTELDTLIQICLAAAEAGADTLGIADTVGIANPRSMTELVTALSSACPLPIAVHCHNDLGLATANSLAGLQAGASGVQCSVLGVGERAGNAPLEQVVLALHASMNHDTGLDLAALNPLARYVSGLIGVPIAPYQPVAGANAFTHESGLHLDGITQDPATYEPYVPELVGRDRRIVLGKHSGLSSVLTVARSNGIDLDNAQARDVLAAIKKSAQNKEFRPPLDAADMVLRFVGASGRSD